MEIRTRHFSHFGTVEAPEKPDPRLLQLEKLENEVSNALRLVRDVERNWNGYERTEGGAREALDEATRLVNRARADVFNLTFCMREYRTSSAPVDAIAYQPVDLDDQAVLIVECEAGGWREVGVVNWPLRFVSPAAVAASCCAPRFGVGEFTLIE